MPAVRMCMEILTGTKKRVGVTRVAHGYEKFAGISFGCMSQVDSTPTNP